MIVKMTMVAPTGIKMVPNRLVGFVTCSHLSPVQFAEHVQFSSGIRQVPPLKQVIFPQVAVFIHGGMD